jgi:phosphomevalonate kinase
MRSAKEQVPERLPMQHSAPAKLVISGEYAVLTGAPALVMALNRRVSVALAPPSTFGWQFHAKGMAASSRHDLTALLSGPDLPATDPAMLCQQLLKLWPAGDPWQQLPADVEVRLNSSALFEHGKKLGLGSSAAITVALASALADLASFTPTLNWPLTAHRAAQQGRGSGLDVASAWHGGLIQFQLAAETTAAAGTPQITVGQIPAGLHMVFVYAGYATSTSSQVSRFETWRQRAGTSSGNSAPPALQALCSAATEVVAATSNPVQFMAKLRVYTDALLGLDQAAELGIHSDVQHQLAAMASESGLLYKPCGAGGGDMGIAFGLDPDEVLAFKQRARAAGFSLPAMEPDPDGRRRDN